MKKPTHLYLKYVREPQKTYSNQLNNTKQTDRLPRPVTVSRLLSPGMASGQIFPIRIEVQHFTGSTGRAQ